MQSDFEMAAGGIQIPNQVEQSFNPNNYPFVQQIQHLPFTQQFFQYRSILQDNNEVQAAPFFPFSERGVEEDAFVRPWQNPLDSSSKQPFWRPQFSNGKNNESEKKKQGVGGEMYDEQVQSMKSLEENKCFGELEAIYAGRNASESVVSSGNEELGIVRSSSGSAKRKRKEGMSGDWMERYFESLVKKVMKQQEDLQRRFMERIERMDEKRREREEAWREQEIANLKKEAADREEQRKLASSREAALVSYLEKISGQKINFVQESSSAKNNRRWAQAEVDALIQIREAKGLLWEEVSNSMATMGYQRSATRCKHKWENLQKSSSNSSSNSSIATPVKE